MLGVKRTRMDHCRRAARDALRAPPARWARAAAPVGRVGRDRSRWAAARPPRGECRATRAVGAPRRTAWRRPAWRASAPCRAATAASRPPAAPAAATACRSAPPPPPPSPPPTTRAASVTSSRSSRRGPARRGVPVQWSDAACAIGWRKRRLMKRSLLCWELETSSEQMRWDRGATLSGPVDPLSAPIRGSLGGAADTLWRAAREPNERLDKWSDVTRGVRESRETRAPSEERYATRFKAIRFDAKPSRSKLPPSRVELQRRRVEKSAQDYWTLRIECAIDRWSLDRWALSIKQMDDATALRPRREENAAN